MVALPRYRPVRTNEPCPPPKNFRSILNPDFIHPPFGPVCPVLQMPDFRLKFLYPLFSGLRCADTLSDVWLFASAVWLVHGIRLALHWPLLLPPPLAECRLNTLQDNIMDFDALFERRLPKTLVNGLAR